MKGPIGRPDRLLGAHLSEAGSIKSPITFLSSLVCGSHYTLSLLVDCSGGRSVVRIGRMHHREGKRG